MADPGRGLPLLSGPPPPTDGTHAEIACRKCNKEFNVIFTRSRKCNHCGFSYCHSCSDYQALMPRGGMDAGYDSVHVCGFCIELLTTTAGGRSYLKAQPLSKLKKYTTAYNIKLDAAVEKDDLIDAIMNARGSNGCLPPSNESYYRKYSVPNKVTGTRPRGLFSRSAQNSNTPPQPPPRPPTQPAYNFPRPDLAPDHPPPAGSHYQYQPPPGPPPPQRPQPQQQYHPQPQQNHYQAPRQPPPQQSQYYQAPPGSPPHQQHQQQYHHYFPPPQQQYGGYQHYHTQAPPPVPPQASRPTQPQPNHPYGRPTAARSSQNLNTHQPTPPPRPRTASAAAPTPPPRPTPSLNELVNMSREQISALGIGVLKNILFTNHVSAGMVLEKEELVKKVIVLVDSERVERERQRMAEEQERIELEEMQRERAEARERERLQREERERAAAAPASPPQTSSPPPTEGTPPASDSDSIPVTSTPPKATAPTPPLAPKAQAMASHLERTGLCVICQDEEANIAIVDCGHLAMCRGCSDMVMTSSRECPLCRTRIVTEQRLLRIFKT